MELFSDLLYLIFVGAMACVAVATYIKSERKNKRRPNDKDKRRK